MLQQNRDCSSGCPGNHCPSHNVPPLQPPLIKAVHSPTRDRAEIETVTNVAPHRDEMYPVILCALHKTMLARGDLDIRQNEKGDLYFIVKKKEA